MFLVEMISWWYSDGWKCHLDRLSNSVKASSDFFSIKQLAITLFEPFRQISANQVEGAINVVIQSFFDRLLSRFVGFFMRSLIIFAGCVAVLFQSVFGLLIVLVWFALPFLPFIGIILSILRVSIG